MDHKLPLRIRMGIKIHLMMCHLCLRYKKQLELIHEAISKTVPDKTPDELITPLPDHARKKIEDDIKSRDEIT